MKTIGIDPGLTGAIAVVDHANAQVFDMPVAEYSAKGFVKHAVDLVEVRKILIKIADKNTTVWLEQVQAFAQQGVSSVFSLGMSFWGVAGVACGLGLSVRLMMSRRTLSCN